MQIDKRKRDDNTDFFFFWFGVDFIYESPNVYTIDFISKIQKKNQKKQIRKKEMKNSKCMHVQSVQSISAINRLFDKIFK